MRIPDETTLAKILVKTHYIVKVLEFHPESQTVDVIQETFEYVQHPAGEIIKKNEFGYEVNMMLAMPDVIYGVPVQQLRWGKFSIQCAPKAGDTGYIEVMTDDSRGWVEDGGPSMPWLATKMNKESCVFVPFVANKKNAAEDYPEANDRIIIKGEGTVIEVSEEDSGICAINARTRDGSILLTQDTSKEENASTVEINANTVVVNSKEATVTADKVTMDADEVSITGKLAVDGEISSGTDIKTGSVSLKNHTHQFNYVGAGTGSTPQVGTTQKP